MSDIGTGSEPIKNGPLKDDSIIGTVFHKPATANQVREAAKSFFYAPLICSLAGAGVKALCTRAIFTGPYRVYIVPTILKAFPCPI